MQRVLDETERKTRVVEKFQDLAVGGSRVDGKSRVWREIGGYV